MPARTEAQEAASALSTHFRTNHAGYSQMLDRYDPSLAPAHNLGFRTQVRQVLLVAARYEMQSAVLAAGLDILRRRERDRASAAAKSGCCDGVVVVVLRAPLLPCTCPGHQNNDLQTAEDIRRIQRRSSYLVSCTA